LLQHLLRAGLDEATKRSSDFVIFSNVDINVMPHFYAVVVEMLSCHQTFFLNRVEIPDALYDNLAGFHLGRARMQVPHTPLTLKNINTAFQYTTMFQQLHPGYDCFVVATGLLSRLADKVGDVFVGFPPAGAVLAEAARSVDRLCVTARRIPATFHVGSRNGEWEGVDAEQYISINGALARRIPNRPKAVKGSKCRAMTFKTKGKGKTKCYPIEYYPISINGGNYLHSQDYAQLQAKRNRSRNVHF